MSLGNRILLYTVGSLLAAFLVKGENARAFFIIAPAIIGICEIAFRLIRKRRPKAVKLSHYP